jgi:hypothetical protein
MLPRTLIGLGLALASGAPFVVMGACSDSTSDQPTTSGTGAHGGSGGSGGHGTAGTGGSIIFPDQYSCTTGQPCEDGGICAGNMCCAAELACAEACCQGGEVCSFQACVTPGAMARCSGARP